MRSSDSDIRAESCNTTPSLVVFGVVFYGEYFTQNIEIFSDTQPPSQSASVRFNSDFTFSDVSANVM